MVQLPQTKSGITLVDRAMVDRCHRRGVAVHVWIVNDVDEMRRLRSIGVDAIITDRPDVAVKTLWADGPVP